MGRHAVLLEGPDEFGDRNVIGPQVSGLGEQRADLRSIAAEAPSRDRLPDEQIGAGRRLGAGANRLVAQPFAFEKAARGQGIMSEEVVGQRILRTEPDRLPEVALGSRAGVGR